jgi:hypothetical protein
MLGSTRFFTLASVLTTAGLVLACASDPMAPIDIEAKKSGSVEQPSAAEHGLLQCTPQPYAADSAWIGPKGGEIKIGKNKFTVPKGALDATTLITMELPSDTVKSVRFGPEGLTFNAGALPKLKLDYKNCEKSKGKKASIVYVTEQLEVIEVLPSADDNVNDDVHSEVEHFSRYAVYY